MIEGKLKTGWEDVIIQERDKGGLDNDFSNR